MKTSNTPKISIRTGYVHLRNGDLFLTLDNACEPSFVVARNLRTLMAKAELLRKRGYEVGTTAWQQIGTGDDAYTKSYCNV
jgi:hypothetical protein